jgi:DNA-directed RNA polymerase subunit N (RpoN/RPB10)
LCCVYFEGFLGKVQKIVKDIGFEKKKCRRKLLKYLNFGEILQKGVKNSENAEKI